METGGRTYLFSDGISEYEAPDGEMFGEQRLIDHLLSRSGSPREESMDDFMLMLHDFSKGSAPTDDISLFAIEYSGTPEV